MKTVKQWLELIKDDEIRERALYNCEYPNVMPDNVHQALQMAFIWFDSPEGHEYWEEIFKNKIELRK